MNIPRCGLCHRLKCNICLRSLHLHFEESIHTLHVSPTRSSISKRQPFAEFRFVNDRGKPSRVTDLHVLVSSVKIAYIYTCSFALIFPDSYLLLMSSEEYQMTEEVSIDGRSILIKILIEWRFFFFFFSRLT